MQEKSSNKIDEKLLDKIIAVAYSDAGLYDRMVVWINAMRDPEIKELLDEYKLTASSVHSLEEKKYPEANLKSVYHKIGQRGKSNPAVPFIHSFIHSFNFSKPLVSSAAVGLIIVAIVSVLLFYNPPPEQKYSKAEIEFAQKQLGESLAIVNKVFHQTRKKIDAEVITKYVSKPLNKGLNLINDYLIGG
ncbi:MAG: hypothetical protein IH852_00185 [Bacteroidetes bacterium]|nr:hypothetical protein [Bacteroidota bacterium]